LEVEDEESASEVEDVESASTQRSKPASKKGALKQPRSQSPAPKKSKKHRVSTASSSGTPPSPELGHRVDEMVTAVSGVAQHKTSTEADLPTKGFPSQVFGHQRGFDSYYGKLDVRFGSGCSEVPLEELLVHLPCVVVKGKSYDTNMYMSPEEFYFISNLCVLQHGLQYEAKSMQAFLTIHNHVWRSAQKYP
jgi:hypothetical protein